MSPLVCDGCVAQADDRYLAQISYVPPTRFEVGPYLTPYLTQSYLAAQRGPHQNGWTVEVGPRPTRRIA